MRSSHKILVIFVLVNAAIMLLTVDGAALKYGSDVLTWYRPALGLLAHGDFVDPVDPSLHLTLRPPLYPMMIAALFGSVKAVVVVQLGLLFGTGLLARAACDRLLPGYGTVALVLTVFNPAALGNAHMIGADTLYAFTFMCLIYALLWQNAIIAGLWFGLSLLVRNPLEALLPVTPFVMAGLVMLVQGRQAWWRGLVFGSVVAAVAFAVVLPWFAYNYEVGDGFGETTQYQKLWFMKTELAALENCRTGDLEHRQLPADLDAAWAQMKNYSIGNYACALGNSFVLMAVTPGVTNFSQLFGLQQQSDLTVLRTNRFDEFLYRARPATLLLLALGLTFIAVVRFLNVVGAMALLRDRQYCVLAVIFGATLYMTLIVGFGGNSRYRLPVDPLLFVVAAFGLRDLARPRVFGVRHEPSV